MAQPSAQSRFFTTQSGVSPYLVRWHQAFSPRKADSGPLVELWFDRQDAPPLREAVCLPRRLDSHTLHMAALYLTALLNNKLCVWGARRVSLVSQDAALAQEFLQRVTDLFLYKAAVFSDLTPYFILALHKKRYGEQLILDTDQAQAARLARLFAQPAATASPAAPPARHSVLAVNIGQFKTSSALVSLDGTGGYALSREHRQETWPNGQPYCYPLLAEQAMAAMARNLGPLPPEVEAVCCSLAGPVVKEVPYGVAQVGLCATCSQDVADGMGQALIDAAEAAFPGRPVFLINDADAQGLFASRFCRQSPEPDVPGYTTNLLSIRFGACPSVSYIDAAGRNMPRLNEYPWLVTTVHGGRPDAPLFSTISPYISFHGIGNIANELGLLEKYGVSPNDAAACFHDCFTSDNPARQRDAFKVYYVLGAHIAMLASEIDRDTPLRHVQLLGSDANKLDKPVFTAIWNGFADFIDHHALPFNGVDFTLAEGTSAYASLVGAAVAYADKLAEKGKRPPTAGQDAPEPQS